MKLVTALFILLMGMKEADFRAMGTNAADFEEHPDENGNPPQTIIGGDLLTPMDRGRRPYLVNLGRTLANGSDFIFCAGSLISPHVVLTAAHCVLDNNGNVDPPGWVDFLRYSRTDTSGFLRVPISPGDVIAHERYNQETFANNDVAVLILPSSVNMAPVLLNANQMVPATSGIPLDVAGWGLTSNNGDRTDVPFKVILNYVSNEDCTKEPFRWAPSQITSAMMCATAIGKSACQGDSGGPILLGSGESVDGQPVIQVGIVSFGPIPCQINDVPSVFTRISDVWGWVINAACARTGELCVNISPTTSPVASKSGKHTKRLLKT